MGSPLLLHFPNPLPKRKCIRCSHYSGKMLCTCKQRSFSKAASIQDCRALPWKQFSSHDILWANGLRKLGRPFVSPYTKNLVTKNSWHYSLPITINEYSTRSVHFIQGTTHMQMVCREAKKNWAENDKVTKILQRTVFTVNWSHQMLLFLRIKIGL